MAISIGRVDDLSGQVFEADNILLKINDSTSQQQGKLIILERALIFLLENAEAITIPWTRVGLHAIQNINGVRKVYFMIESEIVWPGVYEKPVQNNGNNIEDDEYDEGHESDESSEFTEFWLQPIQDDNPALIDLIFNSMKHAQSLNPDPADSISEDEDYMEAEDDGVDGSNQMRHLNLEDDDRFADAEEEGAE